MSEQKEIECPCEESGRVECAVCQDLPVWYFDKPKKEEKT